MGCEIAIKSYDLHLNKLKSLIIMNQILKVKKNKLKK